MRINWLAPSVATCLGLFLVSVPLTSSASGQDDTIVQRLELKGADIRDALAYLFKISGRQYFVDPSIRGTVTADFRQVRFTTALRSALAQVDANYRIEGGTYVIVPNTDPQDVGQRIIPAIDLERVEVREALKTLFRAIDTSYSIDPAVTGTVTISLRNQPFETVLRNVLNQVDATYRVEGGIYQIVRRESPYETVSVPNVPRGIRWGSDPSDHSLVIRQPEALQATIYGDSRYLYIMRGNQLLKLEKKDLKVVAKTELPPVGG